ncbi:MAG TPA: Rid family hydrolase [Candidatus Polarisedimenticolaceae bacterium]
MRNVDLRVPCLSLGGDAEEDDWSLPGTSIVLAVEVDRAADAALEAAALDTYLGILAEVERAGYPHLVRAWNFVPGINGSTGGFERYALFCRARAQAFETRFGREFESRLCAASAVGADGDALVVHVVASREPGRAVENPRQVAAWRYPDRYGPCSPSFVRATVWRDVVFVSGTASVVGHESVHPGDPSAQTEETMTNVASVLEASGTGARVASLRTYVRNADDVDAIRAAIARAGFGGVPNAWFRADICRKELLVEIEAVAR